MCIKNIITIVILCIGIGMLVYIYYDPYSSSTKPVKAIKEKKVTFNDIVTLHTYDPKEHMYAPNESDIISDVPSADEWDSSFGFPLMSKDEKRKYFAEMQKNHKRYERSMLEFDDFKSDRSNVVKVKTSLDPFKPDYRSDTLKGREIKDIYDEQVQGPRAASKKIKYSTDTCTIYDDESDLNGRAISGTDSLYAYNSSNDFKLASFGDDF